MKVYIGENEIKTLGHYITSGDIKDATLEPEEALSSKTFYNNNGKQTGTMVNQGGVNTTLSAGESYSIPQGYHNGEGVVKAQDLASQTTGDAGAGDIASGKTAYVNGNKLTGSLVVPAVNDWDPKEMEEDVMLDLTNYTLHGILDSGESTQLSAGTYIICIASSTTSVSTSHCGLYDSNNKWMYLFVAPTGVEYYKIVLNKQYTMKCQSSHHATIWKKN